LGELHHCIFPDASKHIGTLWDQPQRIGRRDTDPTSWHADLTFVAEMTESPGSQGDLGREVSMKRFSTISAIAMLGALASATPAAAASVEPHPLDWATGDTIDWAQGGLLLLFGAAGALFTIFALVGGVVPGTAGQAQIDRDNALLSKWTQKLSALIEGGRVQEIEATEMAVRNLRRDVTRERWRQFVLASALYLLLGAFFAAVLADDLLQAAAIGAGWTAVAGNLGLKSDYAERKEAKDEVIAGYQEHVHELKLKADAKPNAGQLEAAAIPPPRRLEQASEVALTL
jgi:hypothetical protein